MISKKARSPSPGGRAVVILEKEAALSTFDMCPCPMGAWASKARLSRSCFVRVYTETLRVPVSNYSPGMCLSRLFCAAHEPPIDSIVSSHFRPLHSQDNCPDYWTESAANVNFTHTVFMFMSGRVRKSGAIFCDSLCFIFFSF
jgi:hypothetical protein